MAQRQGLSLSLFLFAIRVIIGCAWLISLPGCFFHENSPVVATPWFPVKSAKPFFPLDVGTRLDTALSTLTCDQWESHGTGDRASLELRCASYRLSFLSQIAQSDSLGSSDTGELWLTFQNDALTAGLWVRKGEWDLTLLRHHAQFLDAKIRERLELPYFSNLNPSEWDPAIERGEFHERWYLGSGILFLWVGKTGAAEEPAHSLTLQVSFPP